MGRTGLQFLLLLWKNYVLQKRRVLVTIVEIILPALFSLILIFIRQRVKTEHFSEGMNFTPYSIDNFPSDLCPQRPFCLFSQPWQMYYTPDDPLVAQIMEKLLKNNRNKFSNFTAYKTEDAMVADILKDFQGSGENGTDSHVSDILGGIVFERFPQNLTNIKSHEDLKYKIRLRYSWSGTTGSIGDIFSQAENKWNTAFMYPLFQIVGPRNKENNHGGPPGYYHDGFLTLQYQLDLAILQVLNSSIHFPADSVLMQRFPYPPWINDNFVLVLQQQFPFLLLLSFIFCALHIVKDVVHEKERKLKETLKMMGINNWLHWVAWFIKYFLFLLLSVLLMTILLCVPASSKGSVVGYTSPSVLFVFLMAFAVSTISFSFMVSVFFSKANSGAAAGGVLFFITYIPYSFLQPRYNQLSWGAKIATCLISNTAMSFGGQVIGMFEGTGKGVQWSNINSGVTVDDDFTMLHVILMLLLDSFLYGLVTWYVEAVFPGEYGVPKAWYFPVQPSYWCGTKPEKDTVEEETTSLLTSQGESNYFEADPVGLNAGIKMNRLRKVYKSASGPAVHGTSLSMYEGQITALLGHNGAGKTTTISMLTGFIPPTSGNALVNGYNITEDIQSVRDSIGLCPQHDVLFDNITVEEHLWFFAKLKGVESGVVSQEIDRYLTILGLAHKKHARSKTLSGGQKRKLSVGIALIGDSKVVILDEPSSGMDPNARRQTWEILQQHKYGRTVILTTHHMDEADVLGDRIAIMAEGVVKCCGTPLFLKNKYGAGYHLVIVKSPDCDVTPITELIQKHVPTMQLESNISAEVRYRLPYESKGSFEFLFSELESRMSDLSVTSFGVSVTTMEEVFLKVGEDATDATETSNYGSVSDESQSSRPSGTRPSVNNYLESTISIPRKQGGFLLYVQQFCAMFIKRALYTRRNLVVTISQLLVPLVFTLMALIVIKTIPSAKDSPSLTLNMSHFDRNQVLYSIKTGTPQQSHKLSHLYKAQFNMYPKVNAVSVDTDLGDALISEGKEDLAEYNENYLIASSIQENLTKGYVETIAWFNNQAYHTPALSLAVIMNTWLEYFTGANLTITTVNHPLPRSLQQKINDQFLESFEGFTVAFNVLFGLSFLVSSFTLFLIKERATKAKHVQFVSGVHSITFWLSTMCWDFINFLLPAGLLLILFVAFGIEAYSGDDRIGYIALLFLLFGWAVLPFIYLMSFIFTVPSSGLVWLTMFNILSGVATVLAVDILLIPQLNTTQVAHSLEWTFLTVLPHFCLGQGLEDFYNNYQFLQICERKEVQFACELGMANPCCKGNCGDFCLDIQENYLSWEQGGIGRMLIFLSVQGVVYFLLLLLIESELLKVLWYKVQDSLHAKGRSHRHTDDVLVQEDSDVAIERQRIATTAVDTLCGLDMLVMTELKKYYGNVLAVESLSVGIPQGECFGLLGVNGAGKTSTFKMLTGDEMITSGEAYLDGFNVKHNIKQVQQRVGYCPQFDALIDHMTGTETLTMYARLRGVNECDIKKVVSSLLKELLLEEHASKLVKAYSGGNKRKLSTAIALVGSPPVIFLDEPSTGMDPVARRHLWDTLARVRAQGSTLVLTSHSMEECEALCTRIAIMVNGQFKCMGSPQHLKNKFGEGYTLIAKVRYPTEGASQPNTQAFITFINSTFPGSILKDVHQGMIHFHITAPGVTWSQLFSVLEKSHEKYDLEDYSISQTSLEQVFINFARAQIPPQEVTRTCCTRLTSCFESCCCTFCLYYNSCRCCGSHDPEELQVLTEEERDEV